MTENQPQFLNVGADRIAYHHTKGEGPGVLFLGGFMSDMSGSKATALEAHAQANGWQFTRMDYGGHGQSSGTFAEGTVNLWADHALAVLDEICTGPQVLVGSSMGGWIMLLLALKRPEKVVGLVGIAAAPDFTEDLIWEAFSDAQKQQLRAEGQVVLPNCMPGEESYPITQRLIEEGRELLLLRKPSIPITCPVHLLHGVRDADVPWERSLTLMHKLDSTDVEITYIKDGDHRLSTPDNLALIGQTAARMRQKAGGKV